MLRVRVYARVPIRFGANPAVLVLSVNLHLPKGKLQTHHVILDERLQMTQLVGHIHVCTQRTQ